ncbi:hypothetical protein BC936DRAFT_138072 [Jimgerdemannia flammicorona]|uniref:Histidine phosphatase superfamily n=1 Tax=Jimgerdemannia flammicorona TaxID=994334 RepID=A0A433DMR8_9FUNG|nr:hypothetical protein BC936DRAFT_138072 [Jimgerdemannia flammicorona]
MVTCTSFLFFIYFLFILPFHGISPSSMFKSLYLCLHTFAILFRLNFLPRTFDPNQFYLRSTDYARTQESIQQLISAGLYPSQFRPDSFALKIHTRDLNEDNLFPNPSCARLRTLAKQFKAVVAADMDEKMKSIAERLKGYVKEVTLDSHPSANGILGTLMVWKWSVVCGLAVFCGRAFRLTFYGGFLFSTFPDTIFAAKVHGIPIPPEFDDAIFLDLEEVVVKEWFHGPQQSEEMRRLGMGRLMGEIQDRIVRRAEGRTEEERKAGDDELKMAVYAGHDTSIAPMLILLDAFDNKWPPFSSIIIFELLQDTTVPPKKTSSWFPAIFASKKPDPVASASTHYVRVRYNDRILRLPGCAALGAHHASEDTSLCTMDAFRKIVEGQVPKNYIEECGVQQ